MEICRRRGTARTQHDMTGPGRRGGTRREEMHCSAHRVQQPWLRSLQRSTLRGGAYWGVGKS